MTCEVKMVSSTQVDEDYIDLLLSQIPAEEQEEVNELMNNKEGLMAYVARVSSSDQTNKKYAGLLKYCIKHKHWSVFQMVDVCLEIETSRAIAAQVLRHASFSFQEFSQRYQSVSNDGIIIYEARRQDDKNRQNSIDDLTMEDKLWFAKAQKDVWELAYLRYEEALKKGIAKESARFLLPLNTKTRLYMKGSLRSWIHYIDLRTANGTQKEHMEIALKAREAIKEKFPIISEAMGW